MSRGEDREPLKVRPVMLSVRDFALPSPRKGSIEAHSGYGPVPQQGIELHGKVQSERERWEPNYEREYAFVRVFNRGGYAFRVSGRVDGFTPGPPPICEELKTAFDPEGLIRRLKENSEHPYWLQLLTYGYLHYLETNVVPECLLTVVSARNAAETALPVELNVASYEAWLARRLDELVELEEVYKARGKRRRKVAKKLKFPFAALRPGQAALMAKVADAPPEQKHLLIEAPTGMGKTLGIMLPALKKALRRGAPLLYLTPKNSQHSAAESAAKQLRGVKTLTLTAKTRICMKTEVLCNPEYCEFARDYHSKVADNQLIAELGKLATVTDATLREFAKQYEVCPAELALDAAAAFDLVIGDYNYVIQPHSLVGRITATARGEASEPALVLDEAHNLYSRATENLSATLSLLDLTALGAAAQAAIDCSEVVERTLAFIKEQGPETMVLERGGAAEGDLLRLNGEWQQLLAAYLSSDAVIGEKDPVLILTGYWRSFREAVSKAWPEPMPWEDEAEGEVGETASGAFTLLFEKKAEDQLLRVICCDASMHLRESFKPFASVVAFSATLRPFAFYASLSGLDPGEDGTVAFPSPFPKEHRKVLVIPQVSTKLKDRASNLKKISSAIARLTAVRPGNYLVFFPSFQFLRDVAEHLSAPGFEILAQAPGMSRAANGELIARLRSGGPPAIILGVQGGSLAEGIDYPGEQVIGAIIVGPALPSFDVPREVLRDYYDRTYGNGDDYAYTYPAMAKVVQAAGRVIRTDTDKGLIVLMDRRFVERRYSSLLPTGWYETSVRELVSERILADIEEFWLSVRDLGSE